MGLDEDDRRLLGRYHAFLRARGLTVCERVSDQDGGVRHRIVRLGRGTELIGAFESWLERGDEATRRRGVEEDGRERRGAELSGSDGMAEGNGSG